MKSWRKKKYPEVTEKSPTKEKMEAEDRKKYSSANRQGTPKSIKGAKIDIVANNQPILDDPNFLRAMYVDWMSDPKHAADISSQALFCQIYKCPPALVKMWTKNKEVQGEIRKTVRELFGGGERIKKLYDRLWEQADKGIISAIRLALELTGEYTPKLQHLDKPKSLEDMLEQMEKADKGEAAGVFPKSLKLTEDDGPTVH